MKRLLTFVLLLLLLPVLASAEDLDQAYRKNFGSTTIVATNGDYPPVGRCNPSQFDWRNGASYVEAASGKPVNFRSIIPKGKRFNDFYQTVLKQQRDNLKFKQKDVIYYRIWSDRDESGNPLDVKKHSWPKSVGETPNWKSVGFFTTTYSSETGTWDTVGLNAGAYNENIRQYFYSAKPGQKFYITLAVGYSYMVGAGQNEQKWNPVLKRTETVVSSGELGFAVSEPISAGTIIIK